MTKAETENRTPFREDGREIAFKQILNSLWQTNNPVCQLAMICEQIRQFGKGQKIFHEESVELRNEGRWNELVCWSLPILLKSIRRFRDCGINGRSLFEIGTETLFDNISEWNPKLRRKNGKHNYLSAFISRNLGLAFEQAITEVHHLGDSEEFSLVVDPEEKAIQDILKESIQQLIGELNPRAARVIRLRFGLDGGNVQSLEEISKKLGITRSGVWQIEGKALKQLKTHGVVKQIRDFW